MVVTQHQWPCNWWHVPYFCCLFDRLPDWIKTGYLHYRILEQSQIRLELILLECTCSFEGVRAICRFWVFDGNGLMGHRSIPVGLRKIFQRKVVENCVRKKKKNAHVPVFRAEMLVSLSSSRHLVPPFDLHTFFAFDSGSLICRSLVVEGSVVRSWFFVKLYYSCSLCCSRNNKKPE